VIVAMCAIAVAAVSPAFADEPLGVDVDDLPPLPEDETADQQVLERALERGTQVEDTVVLGASKREQSLGDVASAVTVITGTQLRRFGHRTVAEALRTVVGVYITDDRMMERVGIRGVQILGDPNTRILVLIDGSTVNEPWRQYVSTGHALPVHIDDVARIEVIRGPVSSIYGTNAFLGIINIVTMGADEEGAHVFARGSGSSDIGFDTVAGFGYGAVDRRVRGSVSFTSPGGESIGIGDSFETNADDQNALTGALSVHYDRLFFQARAVRRARELPGAPYNSAIGSHDNRNVDSHVLGEVGYTQDLTESVELTTRAYVSRYRFENTLEFDGGDGFDSIGDALWYGAELRALSELLDDDRLSATVGASTEFNQTESSAFYTSTPGQAFEVDTDFNIAGVYAELSSSPLSWLAGTVGLRYDQSSIFENNLSTRAALFLRRDTSYGVKLLYAEGFRNPSIFEAFYEDGADDDPGTAPGPRYRQSGQDLFPELITSYEVVGWLRPAPGTNLRVSAWRWDLERLIEKRRVLDPTFNPPRPRLQFHNIFRLRSQGLEIEGSYRDAAGWLGFANATIAIVERNPDILAEDAENAPVFTANAGVSSPLIRELFHASTEVAFVGPRDTRDVGVTTDPFLLWNAVLHAPEVRDNWDITLGVRNILGIREQVPAQIDYDRVDYNTNDPTRTDIFLIPGAGREFFVRVGYRGSFVPSAAP
jgi:iron complex outermembrane receptor protein